MKVVSCSPATASPLVATRGVQRAHGAHLHAASAQAHAPHWRQAGSRAVVTSTQAATVATVPSKGTAAPEQDPAAPLTALSPEQVAAYAARIGVTLPLEPTLDNLRTLVAAQLRSVPFENTTVHTRELVSTSDLAPAYQRIVTQRRGGFCFDLNTLFAQLLTAVGYDVRFLATRVLYPTHEFGPLFDHMAVAASIPGDEVEGRLWLTDVGFPTMTYGPLDLSRDSAVEYNGDTFEVARTEDGDCDIKLNGKTLFRAELKARTAEDFRAVAWFHASNVASPFLQGYLCTRATDDGRVTLAGNRLIETARNGERKETQVSDADLLQAYDERFGIKLAALPPVTKPSANPWDFWVDN